MRGCQFFSVAATATALVAAVLALEGQERGRGRGGGRGTPIQAGEERPEGTTEVRLGRCQGGASTTEHRGLPPEVDRGRRGPPGSAREVPVVDSHSHLRITPENIDQTPWRWTR